MTITVKRKVLALAIGAASLPLVVMLGLTIQFQRNAARQAEFELHDMAQRNLEQAARDVYALCETSDALIQERMALNLRIARQVLDRVRLQEEAGSTAWDAINQETQQTRQITLPRLLAAGAWLGQNPSAAPLTVIVNEIKRATGVDATILQRMNEQGDMLRVATTVGGAGGERVIGSYIPAIQADGTPNPIITSILKHTRYIGHAQVLGAPYVAAYEPIEDARGRVFSMLFVGERLRNVESVRQAIMKIVTGKSGHIVVIGAKGNQRGRYVISFQGKRDGEDLNDVQDTNGKYFVREMVENALTLPKGQAFGAEYPWRDSPSEPPRKKLAALIYFEPWDWLIDAGTYEDEYFAAARNVVSATYGLLAKLAIAGTAALALAISFAVFLSSRLANPIGVTAGVAQRIASGNLMDAKQELAAFRNGAGNSHGRLPLLGDHDETSDLLAAFRTMTDNLDALIGQVQRSGIQVNSSSTEIAASARELEGTVAEQASSLREVAATSKEISATSTQLSTTMTGVSEAVAEASAQAKAGHGDLNRMREAMQQLLKATASVSARLGAISDRAGKISSVVTTINKISDQTGMLALNAAIEAEKAGEYGKGFSVVAREIGRLSDQTAAATEEIEAVIREMQSSVSGGVMEMDRFSDEVRRRVEEVETVARQLGLIIDQAQALGPQFETVNSGMRAQTEGAQQISQVIAQIAEAADRTRASVQEFKQAAAQLYSAVQALQSEVTRFKISA